MDGKGRRVQIALEVKASFLNEAVVFCIVRNRVVPRGKKLPAIRFAGPHKIGVHESVGAGQQPRRFWRRVLSQLDGKCHGRGHDYQRQCYGESASNSHAMRSDVE